MDSNKQIDTISCWILSGYSFANALFYEIPVDGTRDDKEIKQSIIVNERYWKIHSSFIAVACVLMPIVQYPPNQNRSNEQRLICFTYFASVIGSVLASICTTYHPVKQYHNDITVGLEDGRIYTKPLQIQWISPPPERHC
jgi:hypothetical protein